MISADVAAPSTPPPKDCNHDAAPMIDCGWKRRNKNKIVRKSEKTKQNQTIINKTRMNIGIGASDRTAATTVVANCVDTNNAGWEDVWVNY